MSLPSVEDVIADAIMYDHQPTAGARAILKALEAAGYAVVRNADLRKPDLPETLNVYSADPRNTSMFAGAKVGPRPVSNPTGDLTIGQPAATSESLMSFSGGETVGYCSKCGEARESFYTCRDGGETVPKA